MYKSIRTIYIVSHQMIFPWTTQYESPQIVFKSYVLEQHSLCCPNQIFLLRTTHIVLEWGDAIYVI